MIASHSGDAPPPTRGPIPGGRRPSASIPLILGLGVLFALLFMTQNLIQARVFHAPYEMRNLVVAAFTRWILYAALAPAVGVLCARFPIERHHAARHGTIHVGAGIGFALLHSLAMGLVYWALRIYPRQDSLLEAVERLTLAYFGLDFIVFWMIAGIYHAVRYHYEIRARDQLTAALTTRLAESRLDALRAQLNPHFLFNTLNAVSALAYAGERERVVQTLSSLSDLLRISLDRDLPQEIPLDHELKILDGYLDIQRVRFGGRLTVQPDIDPATREALVPSMLLQPLVENALQHGIEARTGAARVSVTARREAARLRVRVEDSGPGFASVAAADLAGIGLSNTRARLEELYGAAQSLECGNLPGGGAYVQVTLPFRTLAAGPAR